jgi:hypothetical protein
MREEAVLGRTSSRLPLAMRTPSLRGYRTVSGSFLFSWPKIGTTSEYRYGPGRPRKTNKENRAAAAAVMGDAAWAMTVPWPIPYVSRSPHDRCHNPGIFAAADSAESDSSESRYPTRSPGPPGPEPYRVIHRSLSQMSFHVPTAVSSHWRGGVAHLGFGGAN